MRKNHFPARLRRGLLPALVVALVLALFAGLAAPAQAVQLTQTAHTAQAADPPPPAPTTPEDEEDAFNRELVQDIADHAEDYEVRDAARAALATNDPAKIREYLDTGDAIAKKAAAERKKRVAAENRALVTEWSKTAGPTARARALEVLRTNDDHKIADFVAFGKELADAEDRKSEEDAAVKAERIKGRVVDMVARGGPEVKEAGQSALDSEDAVVIEAFFNTGYAVANKRDHDAMAAIEAAQAARNKALKDLQDLADRAARAADARALILKSSVDGVRFLTSASNAMGLGNQAAKRADKIFEEDKPARSSGGRGRAIDLHNLTVEAKREYDMAAGAANDAASAGAAAETAARQLTETGLTHGIEWAKVTKSVASAAQAAKLATETAWHAAEATEAASAALDANSNAQVHADNAAKYRQAAEEHAKQAHELEQAAAEQAAAAQASASRAHDARLKAEQAEKAAWAHALKAKEARIRAQRQQAIAAGAAQTAVTQAANANAAAYQAVEQQNNAIGATNRAIEARNSAVDLNNAFVEQNTKAMEAARKAKAAKDDYNAKDFAAAAKEAEAAQAAGTPMAQQLNGQAQTARQQANLVRPAAEQSRRESDAAAAASGAAAAAAARASAAATQAKIEAATAGREAAKTHQESVRAQTEANRANTEAAEANADAQAAINLAEAALQVAAQAYAEAELTRAEAEAAVGEATIAAVQAKVAGRAALAARVSAGGIASPAAAALDYAGALASTDNDAALAADVAAKALVMGDDLVVSAKKHADQADQAAAEAKEAADRAIAEVKPAYEAAAAAADSAAKAVESAETAIRAAQAASVDAAAATDAGRRAAAADAQARQDAAIARGSAASAANSAAVARQASANAKNDATQANLAANAAEGAVTKAEESASVAEQLAAQVEPVARDMQALARDLNAAIPAMEDAEKHEFILKLNEKLGAFANKVWGSGPVGDFYKGLLQEIANIGYGVYTMSFCLVGFGPDRGQACDDLLNGIAETIKNPGNLIHLDEWKKNPEQALGMTVVDIGTFFIPGPKGKTGWSALGDLTRLGVQAAKAVAGFLTRGVLEIGAVKVAELVGTVGMVNTAKILSEAGGSMLLKSIDNVGLAAVNRLIELKGGVDVGKLLAPDRTSLRVGRVIIDELAKFDDVAARAADLNAQAVFKALMLDLDAREILGPKIIPTNIPAKMLAKYRPFDKLSREEMVQKYWDPQGGWNGKGDWNWPEAAPNNGRVPGSEMPHQAEVGDLWDRFGDAERGKNLSPYGVDYDKRAIPPTNLTKGYHVYEWIKPWDENAGAIERSTVAEAFGQPGGGIQYQTTKTVQELIDLKYIKEIFP